MPLDRAKFVEECVALVEMTPDDEAWIPRFERYALWWMPGPTPGPLVLTVGQEWPFADGFTVVAMFHDDDGEVRVYAMPNRDAKPGEKMTPTRYILTRGIPEIKMESLVLDRFKSEIADEYAILDDDDEEEEEKKPNGAGDTVVATATPAAGG